MKVKEAQIVRAIDEPNGSWRALLLHGPDDAASRALADRLGQALGLDAERVDLDGATLKTDPALLTDEVTAITMFGGPRWIRVTSAGDEPLKALEALLEAPRGAPVAIVTGQLKPASALLKLAIAAPDILACASFRPQGAAADALAVQIARTLGVRLTAAAAGLVADGCNADRGLLTRELEKLALYVDAAPDRPRPVDVRDVEAIGASVDEQQLSAVVDALFDGRVGDLSVELRQVEATDAIPLLRALSRRTVLLMRASNGGAQMHPGDCDAVARQGRRWNAALLARLHQRLQDAESNAKRSGGIGHVLVEHELLTMARAGGRRG